MSQSISLWGATYSNVGGVKLPKSTSGQALFTDVTDTDAVEADVASGKKFHKADGSLATGTASGGGSWTVKQTTWSNTSTSTVSHTFSSLSGTPKAAVLRCTSQLTRSSSNTYYYITDIIWDGTNAWGNYHLRSNGTFNNVAKDANSGFNVSTSTNSITFSSDATSRSSAPGSFYNGSYELTYWY